MNYKLKYAKPIVTVYVLSAVVLLICFLGLIALQHRLLEKKLDCYTELSDATGLSTQTQILFKGFEVGRIKDFYLNGKGSITVHIIIYKKYWSLFSIICLINRCSALRKCSTTVESTRFSFFPNPSDVIFLGIS